MLKQYKRSETFKLRRKEGNRLKTKVIVVITLTLFLVSMLSTVMPVSAVWDSKADVVKDDVIDIKDIGAVTAAFGSDNKTGTPTPNWNADADVNADLEVDVFDLVSVAVHFGEVAPG